MAAEAIPELAHPERSSAVESPSTVAPRRVVGEEPPRLERDRAQTSPARPPRKPADRRGSVRLLAAAAFATIIAAGVGFVVASSSSGGGRAVAPFTSSTSGAGVTVSLPSNWQRQAKIEATPDLQLSSPLALTAAATGGELVIGAATSPVGPTLLPAILPCPHSRACRMAKPCAWAGRSSTVTAS